MLTGNYLENKHMRIALVRHFEVDCHHELLMNSVEFKKWVEKYDCSPIKPINLAVEKENWDKCYCSDLPRAIETANHIYKGEIIKTELLREVPIAPAFETNVRLPYLFWLLVGRLAWLCSHKSQSEPLTKTKLRVQHFVASILQEGNVLIVSHGFLMFYIQNELINRGFSGKRIMHLKHGEVYVYERS